MPDTASEASNSRSTSEAKVVDAVQLHNSCNSRSAFDYHDQDQHIAALEVCPMLRCAQDDCKDGVFAAPTVSALHRGRSLSVGCNAFGNSQDHKILSPAEDTPANVTSVPEGGDPLEVEALPTKPLLAPLAGPVSTTTRQLSTSKHATCCSHATTRPTEAAQKGMTLSALVQSARARWILLLTRASQHAPRVHTSIVVARMWHSNIGVMACFVIGDIVPANISHTSTTWCVVNAGCATDTHTRPVVDIPDVQAFEISDVGHIVARLLQACVDSASFAVIATFIAPMQLSVCTQ